MKHPYTKKKYLIILFCISLTGLSNCGKNQVQVLITPKTVTVPRDQSFPFTVEISNTQDTAVVWSIDKDNGSLGSMDPNGRGIYTPPAVIPTPNTLTVRVTSVADPSATDTANVTVISGNTLQFGTDTPVTDYSNPSGTCTPGTDCIASTQSSGQHSIQVFHSYDDAHDYTTLYTVWSDNRNGTGTYDVFFRQILMSVDTTSTAPSSSYTILLSDTVKINDTSSSSTDVADPSLALDSSGNAYVSWSSGTATNHDIYVVKGTLSSTTTTTTIATTTTITSTTPTTTVTTPTTTTTITIRKIAFGTPVRFDNDSGTSDQRAPSIATDGINVYVAWQDNRNGSDYDLRAALTSIAAVESPTTWTPPVSVPLNNSTTPGNQTEPSVGFFGDSLYIAWTDDQSGNNIYFSKATLAAIPPTWTPNVLVNDPGVPNHIHPSLTVDGNCSGSTVSTNCGNVYVAWQDNRNTNNNIFDIFFAKSIDGGATFLGASDPKNPTEHNIRVTDDTGLGSADHQTPSIVVENPEPNATTSTPDKIYVAWQDNRNHPGSLIFDILTAKSTDGGNTFQKNSAPANMPPGNGSAYNSSISVDTFGRAYVIWTDERNNQGMPGAASDVFFAVGQ